MQLRLAKANTFDHWWTETCAAAELLHFAQMELLLPNRDLDFGYVKLDLGFTYAMKHGFTYFAQIDNLLNDQHIGPLGYPGLPVTFRTGLKLRQGGD